MKKEKIAIDSMSELADYIIQYDLSDTEKNELKNLESLFGLHFTLGLYIRNNYVLSDLIQVPNLIHEFKILNNIATNYDDIDEELRWGYEYFDNLNVNDDDISYSIVKLVWEKLRK